MEMGIGILLSKPKSFKAQAYDKINFEELVKEYRIDKKDILTMYLKEIFLDLYCRADSHKHGINSNTFSKTKYFELPGIISQRIFAVMDVDNDGYLKYEEFMVGMLSLFTGDFEILAKFIFRLYDFNRDNFISKEDIRTLLSYVPLKTNKLETKLLGSDFEKESYIDRVESQEELHDLLEIIFSENSLMDFNQFLYTIENVNSDIFLFILFYLFENKPFNKTTLDNYKREKTNKDFYSPDVNSFINRLIVSPNLNSKFSPSIAISRSPIILKKNLASLKILTTCNDEYESKNCSKNKFYQLKSNSTANNPLLKYTQFNRNHAFNKNDEVIKEVLNDNEDYCRPNRDRANLNNLKKIEDVSEMKNFSNSNCRRDNVSKNVSNDFSELTFAPATKYLGGDVREISDKFSNIKISESDEKDWDESEKIEHEGYVFKLTNSNNLKKVWFRLAHKDLYYYKSSSEKVHLGMHNLSGVFIKEESVVILTSIKLWCFSIMYPNKTRYYYVDNELRYKEWVSKLRSATGYKNLTDIYEIKEKLGKGKFGIVRLVTNKQTQRRCAVKIMSKRHMKENDKNLVKTELEILKICQHPNIIRLYDIFENEECIYIIMEYCAGGDLFNYIEARGYKLPECRTAEIIHKLCMSVYYLHSYGIAHRDLKPENILMSDSTDQADIRLIDFGLSKMIGPDEFCTEPYGTLSYVAPEVLEDKPYSKAVDLWSIGIITYLLLCGVLPFDHETSQREIARQTIETPIPFPKIVWSELSTESKSFVDKLLQKDPRKRMNITQALEHPWLQKFNESKLSEKRKLNRESNESTFKIYTSMDQENNKEKDLLIKQ